jgi:hypothetical protein
MKPLFALVAIAAVAAVPPAAAQQAVDRASLLISEGMAAERANNGRAMLAAARGLEALGARPAGREDDVAAHWRARARALGIRDREPPVRGRALGPAYRRGVLAPGATLSTQQVFLAGQKAEVALVPEPGRTLAFRIAGRDEQICERTATAPRAACSWLPVFTNRVEIRISNPSARPARYYLVSN